MNERPIGTRRWLGPALFVSLLANGLLSGVLIGHQINAFEPAKEPTVAQSFNQGGFAGRIKDLPEEERRKFNQAMKPFRPDIRDARADLVVARQHLAETFLTEPYDAAQVRDALKDVREKTTRLQALVQNGTADALAYLTPESRRKLAGK